MQRWPAEYQSRRKARARRGRWCCLWLPILLLWSLTARAESGGILSLGLCTDWLLVYHGAAGPVSALSPLYRQRPLPGAARRWPSHEGSLEQIYQLRPSLVLSGEFSAPLLRARLQALGVPVKVLPLPGSLAGIEAYERQFLQLVGLPPERARPAPALQAPAADAPRLLLLGANGIGTGRGTFEDQILRQAGWRNYLSAPGYQALDLEQLMLDPPEAVLTVAPTRPALANRFAELPVLRQRIAAQHWIHTDEWRWQCPGPWTWDLIEQLRSWHD